MLARSSPALREKIHCHSMDSLSADLALFGVVGLQLRFAGDKQIG